MDILKISEKIRPACRESMKKAVTRQESLAKPPGSLGGLEDISVRIAGMTGRVINSVDKACVAVFCADNGVCEEGIASAPQSVTMAQTINFTRRLTGVGALAKSFGSELLIVDMGVKYKIPAGLYDEAPLRDTHKIIDRRIRPNRGETDNIAKGPAMTAEEAERAIETGLEMADAIAGAGYEIMGVGEMGIGNTSTSAALLSAISGRDAEETVGRGGGVNDRGFARKKEIVNKVSEGYRRGGGIHTAEQMLEALKLMGGFDICAMTGAYLGAAGNRMPVVIDGYISVVAALAAAIICPAAKDYMIASHKSFERGYTMAVEMLGLKPFMALDMRLGEGSGCPPAFKIIKGACDVMANMATFEEAAIDDGYLEEIRSEEKFRK
ncbi:MAG: nicotinate-nucleotide--dimethylbenzimidazole phosphoribosyltransferase [Bacillota bacterium]|nr:nicotinate-nucleotide--dimethylbenzimidazole phosphoribosyltransferase [Bacillota bacterium]